MNSLQRFYSSKENFEKFNLMRDTQKNGISLRTFDKYTTQYVLSNTVIFPGTYKSVHDSYREQLKSWTKDMFDPNARDHTNKNTPSTDDDLLRLFSMLIPKVGTIEDTNIGQLNFFRWVIRNDIHTLIMNDMENIKIFIKSRNKKKTKGAGKVIKGKNNTNMSASSTDATLKSK